MRTIKNFNNKLNQNLTLGQQYTAVVMITLGAFLIINQLINNFTVTL